MMQRDTSWRFVAGGGLLVVLLSALAVWLPARVQAALHNDDVTRQLLTDAHLVGAALREPDDAAQGGRLTRLVHVLSDDGAQVVLLDASSSVRLGSADVPEAAGLSAAPEVRQALTPGRDWGTDMRPWPPGGLAHIMVAVRAVAEDGTPQGVVWLARPAWALAGHPGALGQQIGIAGGVAALAVLALAVLYVRWRRQVLRGVIQAVRDLSTGVAGALDVVPSATEPATLANTLKALRERLSAQVELVDQQRRMLQSLVDPLQEGVIVARADGRITLVNPTAIRLLNLGATGGPAELLGQPVEECIPHHPLQRLLLGPRPPLSQTDEGTEVEIEADGGTLHLLARAAEVVLAEPTVRTGEPTHGRVVMLTDMTALQRTIQVRTDFVANASHELRTPLSTIRAAVEALLAMDLPTESAAARDFLEKVDRHSSRLQQMVADLLDLSHLETPSEHFQPEAVDCKRLLADLYARFAEPLERKALHWQAEREPPDARTIHVNPHLIRLALDNLVDNAIKFTDAGGHVGVRLQLKPAEATFEVRDDGCGIPADEQQRVFERFYQVARARSGPERGTGLGLSIVRHSVAAMHGTVRLESEPGVGTRVTIAIPQTTTS